LKESKLQLLGYVSRTILVITSSALVLAVFLLGVGLNSGGMGLMLFWSLFVYTLGPGVFIVALIGAGIGALSVRRWEGPAPRRYVVGYVGNLVVAGLVGVIWLCVYALGFVPPDVLRDLGLLGSP